MSFAADIKRFQLTLEQRRLDVFVRSVQLVHESIQTGSPHTTAPGQPVDEGNLRASWQAQFDGPERATVSTNVAYAPAIEDGVGKYGPLTLRSAVGGFHSVKLTIAGWVHIVTAANREVGHA